MIRRYLTLLLGKELRVIRNAHFSTPKKTLLTIGILLIFLLVLVGVTSGLRVGLARVLQEIPEPMKEMVIRELLVIIFIWLATVLFISVIIDSQNKLFKKNDLELLMATPVPPALVFTSRFILFILGSSSTLIQLSIFGICPLLSLGIVAGAPWYYYLFIVPVAYLFLMIPASIGVLLLISLLRILTPKTLFRLAGIFNLFISIIWIVFIIGEQERMLSFLIEWIGRLDWLWQLIRPLQAGTQVALVLLGYGSLSWSLLELLLLAVVCMVLAVSVIQRFYYPVYDRLQASTYAKKKVQHRAKRGDRSGPIMTHWKMALRNYEMAGGAIGMATFLLIYYIILYTMSPEGGILLFLLNLGIVGLCVFFMVFIFLMPADILNDLDSLRRQFWLLKASPLSSRKAVFNSLQTYYWPQIILAPPLLALAHLLAGLDWILFVPALIIFLLLQAVVTLLNILSWYAEYAWGKSVSPLLHVLREWGPMLFYPVFLFLLGLGFFYQRFSFLAFLHSWDERQVFLLSGVLLFGVVFFVVFLAWKRALQLWEQMEI